MLGFELKSFDLKHLRHALTNWAIGIDKIDETFFTPDDKSVSALVFCPFLSNFYLL